MELLNMNRERYLMNTFPDKDGLTYIQSMDKSMRKEKERWVWYKDSSLWAGVGLVTILGWIMFRK